MSPKKTKMPKKIKYVTNNAVTGDVNSLIRKIKPTNFEVSNKQDKNNYNSKKTPFKSILKVFIKRKKILKRKKSM